MVNKKKNDKEVKPDPVVRQYVLTLFLFLLPLLVIAFTQELITKWVLFFYEAVLLANFIRDKMEIEA